MSLGQVLVVAARNASGKSQGKQAKEQARDLKKQQMQDPPHGAEGGLGRSVSRPQKAVLPRQTECHPPYGTGYGQKARHNLNSTSYETPCCSRASNEKGGAVNPRLKQLMKELGEAINESLSESDQIAEVISKIKAGGYDVFLVLEATIGFNKRDEQTAATKPTLVSSRNKSDPEFKVNAQDLKFLKSLRISIDEVA